MYNEGLSYVALSGENSSEVGILLIHNPFLCKLWTLILISSLLVKG